MNTETQTTEKPLSLECFYWQQISNPKTGLCIDIRLPDDQSLLLKRGTPQASTRYDAFADLMRHKTLGRLLTAIEVIPVPPELDASFFPVLWPADVDDELAQDIEDAREEAAIRCVGTAEHLFTGETMGAVLEHAIAHPNLKEVHHKYHFWSQFIARQLGSDWVGVNTLEPLMAVGQVLRERNAPPLVYVVYAPEIVFNNASINETERELLLGLLYITGWVNALNPNDFQHSILFASNSWLEERQRVCGNT